MFRTLKSLLAGLIAGTALGILFSPKSGKEFRSNIKEEVNKGGTGLDTIKSHMTDMGKDIHGTCKDCVDDLEDSEEYKKGKKKAKKYASKAKKEVKKSIKKNVPAKTRKKIKKSYKTAKGKAKKAAKKAKETLEKAIEE